jgi:hypothetical protein
MLFKVSKVSLNIRAEINEKLSCIFAENNKIGFLYILLTKSAFELNLTATYCRISYYK